MVESFIGLFGKPSLIYVIPEWYAVEQVRILSEGSGGGNVQLSGSFNSLC